MATPESVIDLDSCSACDDRRYRNNASVRGISYLDWYYAGSLYRLSPTASFSSQNITQGSSRCPDTDALSGEGEDEEHEIPCTIL